jgi:hypothetical protein
VPIYAIVALAALALAWLLARAVRLAREGALLPAPARGEAG